MNAAITLGILGCIAFVVVIGSLYKEDDDNEIH